MNVLVVTHVEAEGPGLFGRFLAQGGARVRTARLHLGARLPGPGAQDAVLVMGGPMNVYEEAEHPFLAVETAFLREAAERDVGVLGVCLGAQLIAKAAGAPVTKHWKEDVGWGTVTLTEEGAADRLFRFPEVLAFIREAKRHIPQVQATVVAKEGVDISGCQRIADELDVVLRVRKLDVVG